MIAFVAPFLLRASPAEALPSCFSGVSGLFPRLRQGSLKHVLECVSRWVSLPLAGRLP